MKDNKPKGEGEKVFSGKVHKLIISESGVGCSDSQEKDGEKGCFEY